MATIEESVTAMIPAMAGEKLIAAVFGPLFRGY